MRKCNEKRDYATERYIQALSLLCKSLTTLETIKRHYLDYFKG